MKDLSDYETSELIEILQGLEAEYYQEWKHMNGGYAEAESFDCTDDIVYLEVRHGQQDMGSGHSVDYTDELEISREVLQDREISTAEKVANIS